MLKRLSVAFACLVAMCKGFKSNIELLPLFARVLPKWVPCVAMRKDSKGMFRSRHYVQGFCGNVAPCVATCKGFRENTNEGK